MFVKMLEQLATPEQCYVANEVYEAPSDAVGASWVRAGLATISDTPPAFIAEFYARLDDGAGQKCLFLPNLSEWGHLLLTGIRLVHFHKASYKIVCCRPGEEVLFPSANEFCTNWTDPITNDNERVGTIRDKVYPFPEIEAHYADAKPIRTDHLTLAQEMIALYPEQKIPFKVKHCPYHRVDYCLGTRNRPFCPDKNWPHWQKLATRYASMGSSFAVIGGEDEPDLLHQSFHSRGNVEMAIDLLRHCRWFIGTDSASSHLASLCGCEMIIFQKEGYRNFIPIMELHNPNKIHYIKEGWERPEAIHGEILRVMGVEGEYKVQL
jgi:hypothetical protein